MQDTVEAICDKVQCKSPDIKWAAQTTKKGSNPITFSPDFHLFDWWGASPQGTLFVDPAVLDRSDAYLRYHLAYELALNGPRDRALRLWQFMGLPVVGFGVTLVAGRIHPDLISVSMVGTFVWIGVFAALQGPELRLRVLRLTGEIQPVIDDLTERARLGEAETYAQRRKLEAELSKRVAGLRTQAIRRGYIADTDEGILDLPPSSFEAN